MKEQIILTGSCHWCLEAIFQKVKGILSVESGYYHIDDYAFSFGKEDKLEAVRLVYESDTLPLNTLFDILYITHNPTLIKWDKSDCFYPLCRSGVFYFKDEQKIAIELNIQQLINNKVFEDVIQTKIAKVIPDNFFLVNEKYRNYFEKNPKDGYCTSIIVPKIHKLKKDYSAYFKA